MATASTTVPDVLPELPLSVHTNYVTPRGLAQLEARLADAKSRFERLPNDAQLERDYLARHIRWLLARLGSAVLIEPALHPPQQAAFGTTVEVRESDGLQSSYRIVGEDEADLEHGFLSWVSPLARALVGAEVGETVCWRRADEECSLVVLAIASTKAAA